MNTAILIARNPPLPAALFIALAWLPQPARGEGPPDAPRVKYNVAQVSASGGGVYVYVSNKWGMLHLSLANPQDREIEVLCATAFEQEKTLQYGRRIWLPPRSRMETWHPLKLPRLADDAVKQLDYRTSVMEAGPGGETLIRDDAGKMQLTGTLRLAEARSDNKLAVTGMIGPRDPNESRDKISSETLSLVQAARIAEQLPPRITQLLDPFLPPEPEVLQALDQLVIADSRLQDDAAALSAIRRWLYGGGHVWVLLDQIDPRVMELLLGDEWSCQVVDRVGLTTVAIRGAIPQTSTTIHSADFEQPVDLLRTIVTNADVAYTVNGWPAAFWKTCGAGRLLVTTLGPRGWLRLRTPNDPIVLTNAEQSSNPYYPMEALGNLTTEFFAARLPELLPPPALEPQMRDYVGYSIPSRWLVIGLLGGFGILLAGVGLWLGRSGRLERLGLYGPLLSAACSLVFLAIGRQQRNAVPPTVSQVQFVEPTPGTDAVDIRGLAGLFMPDTGTATLEGNHGGLLMPDMTGSTGQTRRLVWTDLERWRWENLPQAAGLRSATISGSAEEGVRVAAVVTFGPQGVTGRLSLPGGLVPEDAVLASRDGRIGVAWASDGTFSATGDRVFSREQFVSARLLTDEQHRRSRTLEQLLTHDERRDYPNRPLLLFWTSPWNMGFGFGEGTQRLGSALVALPVHFERPREGTEVLIPPPLLPYRGAVGPDGMPPTGLYDYRQREWVEKTGNASTWIRFQVPPVLLPSNPISARVVVQVTGPVVNLEIAGWKQGRVTPLHTWINPVGTLSGDITDREVLRLDSDGGLFLRVSGSDPDRPDVTSANSEQFTQAQFWRIEALTLEVRARVGNAAAESNP